MKVKELRLILTVDNLDEVIKSIKKRLGLKFPRNGMKLQGTELFLTQDERPWN
jgi:hypothetical protein